MQGNPMELTVTVDLPLGQGMPAGPLNRLLRGQGFVLHYDVYAFPRPGDAPPWHSGNLANVYLLRGGSESDAQDGADTIRLVYPLPWLFSDHVDAFADLVDGLSTALDCTPLFDGAPYTRAGFVAACDDHVTWLLTEWGEEPGSAGLHEIGENIRKQDYARRSMWAAHGREPPES